jgi:hypothetical protein
MELLARAVRKASPNPRGAAVGDELVQIKHDASSLSKRTILKFGRRPRKCGLNREGLMSALGQKLTFSDARAMSALPPRADIGAAQINVS